jgi:hypothetical protein
MRLTFSIDLTDPPEALLLPFSSPPLKDKKGLYVGVAGGF